MSNPVIYILLNGSLKMSPGKAAAQAVHASKMISGDHFTDSYKRTVIVLEAKDGNQIMNLYKYLRDANHLCAYYIDEGHNEVEAYSITALAAYAIDEDDWEKRDIFKPFKLYGKQKGFIKKLWRK